MKRVLKLMVAAMILLFATPVKAQLFFSNKMMGSQKVEGVIHFNNGTTAEYPEIEVPVLKDRDLTVYDKNKKKTRFDAADIEYIVVWHKTTPEKRWFFSYLDCDYALYKSVWAVIAGVSDYLIVYKLAMGYGVNKRGDLEYYVQDNMSSVATMYFNRNSNTFFRQSLKTVKHFKENFAAFFGDDPLLSSKIKNGEVGFYDWDFILDNYSPQGSQNKVEEKAEAKEETVVEENVEAESQSAEE